LGIKDKAKSTLREYKFKFVFADVLVDGGADWNSNLFFLRFD